MSDRMYAEDMARIAELVTAIEKVDVADIDNPTGIYLEGPIAVRSAKYDHARLGFITSEDGIWGFTPDYEDAAR